MWVCVRVCMSLCVCECVLVLVLVCNSHKKEKKKNNDWKSVADRCNYLFLLIKESETRPLGLSKKRTETFFFSLSLFFFFFFWSLFLLNQSNKDPWLGGSVRGQPDLMRMSISLMSEGWCKVNLLDKTEPVVNW